MPTIDGNALVAAIEILFNTALITDLIQRNEIGLLKQATVSDRATRSKNFGRGEWHKRKGIARVRLDNVQIVRIDYYGKILYRL